MLPGDDKAVEDREPLHVVAYDFGIKQNILRMLTRENCRVTVVPATTTAEEALALNPDGVFFSNGPGDPEPLDYAIETVQKLKGKIMHVQIGDSDGTLTCDTSKHVPLGQGVLNFDQLVPELLICGVPETTSR